MRIEGGQEMVDELELSYQRQIADYSREVAVRDARIAQLNSLLVTAHSGRGVTNGDTGQTGQPIQVD